MARRGRGGGSMRWIWILIGVATPTLTLTALWLLFAHDLTGAYPAALLRDAIADATGEPVTIGPISDADWSDGVALIIDRLTVGDPDAPLLDLEGVTTHLSLVDALSGTAPLRRLHIVTARLRLDRARLARPPAWPLPARQRDGLAAVMRGLDRLTVGRLQVQRPETRAIEVLGFSIIRGAPDSLEVDGRLSVPLATGGTAGRAGTVEGLMDGVIRGASGLVGDSGARVQLRAQAGETRLSVSGSAVQLDRADGLDLTVTAETDSPAVLATLAGITLPADLRVRGTRLRARLRTTANGVGLDAADLRLSARGGTLSARGRIDDIATGAGLDIRAGLSGDDLAPLAALAGLSLPHTDGFQGTARLRRRPDGTLRLEELSGRMTQGATRATVSGAIADLAGGRGIDLELHIQATDLVPLGPLIGIALPATGSVDARFRLAGPPAGAPAWRPRLRDLDGAITVRDGAITLTGGIADPHALTGLDIALHAAGGDLAALSGVIGQPLPATDRYDLRARIHGTPGAPRLDGIDATLERDDSTVAITGAWRAPRRDSGLDLMLTAAGSDLGALAAETGWPLPRTSRFQVEARITGSRAAPAFAAIRADLERDGTAATLTGRWDDPRDGAGLALAVAAQGGDLAAVPELAAWPVPATTRFAITGDLAGSLAAPTVPAFTAELVRDGVTAKVQGRWPRPGRGAPETLTVTLTGDNLEALSDIARRPLPPTDAFAVAGTLTASDDGLRLHDLDARLRRDAVTVTAVGGIDNPFGIPDPVLALGIDGGDPQDLARSLFGTTIPHLPAMTAVRATGDLSRDPAGGGLRLDNLLVETTRPGLAVTARGSIADLASLAVPDLTVTAEGDDLVTSLGLDGRATGLPRLGPFRLSADLVTAAETIAIADLAGTIDLPGATLAVSGDGGRLPDFAGLDLALTLTGGGLDWLGGDLPPVLTAMSTIRGTARMQMTPDGPRLHALDLAGDGPAGRLTAAGTLGRLPDLAGLNLSVELAGTDLFAILLPEIGLPEIGLPLATDRFTVTVQIAGNRAGLAAGNIVLVAERDGLELSGTGSMVALAPTPEGVGELQLLASDVAALARQAGLALPGLGAGVVTGRLSGGRPAGTGWVLALDDLRGEIALPDGQVTLSGTVADLRRGDGVALDIAVRGGDLAALGMRLGNRPLDLPTESYRLELQADRIAGQWALPRLSGRLDAAALRLAVAGAIADPAAGAGLALDVTAAGDAATMLALATGIDGAGIDGAGIDGAGIDGTGIDGTGLGRIEIDGSVAGSVRAPTVTINRLLLGNSDAAGTVVLRPAGDAGDAAARPRLTADLTSTLVDLAFWLDQAGVDGAAIGAWAAGLGTDAAMAPAAIVGSLWPPAGWGDLAATLRWRIGSLAAGDVIIDRVAMTAAADPDGLTIRDARARYDGTPVTAGLSLHRPGGSAAAPVATVRVQAAGADLGGLLARTGLATDIAAVADLAAEFQVAAHGSGAAPSGRLAAVVTEGRLPSRLVDSLVGDLPAVVAAWFAGRPTLPVQCGVLHLTLDQGLGVLDRLAIDTDGLAIVGEGLIDLVNDQVDVLLYPRARDRRRLHAESDLAVFGSLSRPTVDIEPARLPAEQLRFVPGFLLDAAGRLAALAPDGETGPPCMLDRHAGERR